MVRKATAQEVEILPSSRSGAAALLNQSRIAGWKHISGRGYLCLRGNTEPEP